MTENLPIIFYRQRSMLIKSIMLKLKELSLFMEGLGCKAAYNLDGGQSSMMYFNGGLLSTPYNNGRKAGEVSDFTFMQRIDLTPFIVNGENTIEIHAADGGILPCGVLAEIHAGSQIYATGSDWLGAATVDGPFVPAGVVAKFGEEAWGRGVRFCP